MIRETGEIPFVLWDEEREEYLLILGARKGEDKRKQTGRLASILHQKILKKWEFKGDFWAPESTQCLRCQRSLR